MKLGRQSIDMSIMKVILTGIIQGVFGIGNPKIGGHLLV